jgi:hypothetical protein
MLVSKWIQEKGRITSMLIEGKTLKEIGVDYKVSGQRIAQVIEKLSIDVQTEDKLPEIRKRQGYIIQMEQREKRTGRKQWQHKDDLSMAMSSCFTRKKQNVKSSKWEWSILPSDLTFPLVCPILGIDLDWFAEVRAENSPSFDRIDSSKGYVPGNVIICSWRANRIKNDGTVEEHRKIYEFLEKKLYLNH